MNRWIKAIFFKDEPPKKSDVIVFAEALEQIRKLCNVTDNPALWDMTEGAQARLILHVGDISNRALRWREIEFALDSIIYELERMAPVVAGEALKEGALVTIRDGKAYNLESLKPVKPEGIK